MKTGSMPAAEQADSYTTSGVISMIQGLHYKQVNGRDEPMLQNNKPNNKLNNKLDLKKRLFPMLLVLALLSGSVPGALPAAAETPDGNAASETAATETPDGNAASDTAATETPDGNAASETAATETPDGNAASDTAATETPDGNAASDTAAGEDTAGLPQVGQVVNGFEAVETRDYPLMDATAVRFVHQKTGAELYYIANDDTNRVFDLTFFTETLDKTGLPHVFEHAVLSGSEKYPSTQLFFNLKHQTYNTYMNALTYSGYTTYPVASLSEAQLLKYADFYVDSCFHPIILKNEKIFRTEAWRYRLDNADAPLTIEGTVYTEMLGTRTLETNAYNNAVRAMFPGSKTCNEQGGDPDFIPDMTWEMLKDYHARYYHPSNCAAYLYGRFEDYAAFLELLDGYFSAYEKKEFSFTDSGYDPITEPVVLSLPFPLEQGSNTENASVIIYGFVCPGLRNDLEQELVINTMTDLFADGASGLQQSFRDALPYGTLESHIVTMGPEDAVTFIAKNVNPEDAEVFREIVDKAIADVAENGFPADQVDAVMASLETSALLTRESGDLVEDKILPIIEYKVYSGDPWNYLDYQDGLFQMDKWNAQGLYKKAVCDWLADSRTTALVTTWPEPGSREIKDAESAEKLAAVKEGMTEEEIAEIVASSNAAPETEDTSDMVAGLQAVTVESLPEDWKLYEVSDETGEDGIRHIDAAANIEDIGKVNLLLDTSGFGREDIHWLTLYTDLLTALETDSHSKGDLAGMISRYLYNYRILASAWQDGKDGVHPWLQLSWISMDDDLEEGYDLMREILFGTRFDDPVKILEQVRAIRAGMKSDIADDPEELMLNRAFARDSQRMRYNSFAQGLEYYEFLGRTQKQLQDEPEAVTTKLKEIQSRLNNRTNAVAMFAGNENSIALNRQLADGFLASLDARKIEQAEYDLPLPEMNEALVIDSSVQYNMLSASYRALGQNGHEGGMDVLAGLVTDVVLTPLLRDQYGVYSPNCTVYISDDGGMFIYTYRDPNIAETFRVLDDLPEMIAGSGIDQETLDGYILKSYAYYAMPQGELSGAVNAAEAVLKGRPQDESVTSMRQLKQLNLEKLADYTGLLEKFSETGAVRTAGGAAAINAEADRYDKILNPF